MQLTLLLCDIETTPVYEKVRAFFGFLLFL